MGTKKFLYDLWGDAVNSASWMELHGVSVGIQVTLDTYRYIYQHYQFQEWGFIPVKGKGEVFTYPLFERKARLLPLSKLPAVSLSAM